MSARNYHLRASATVTSSAAASVQVIKPGAVKCVSLVLYNATTAAACIALWELSTVPTFQGNTNDAQGIISNGAISSETGILESLHLVDPCDFRVGVGDRLYLHVVFVTGNETQVGIANVAVSEGG